MNNSELRALLQRHPIFSGLTVVQQESLAALVQARTLNADDILMQDGDEADRFFIIMDGQLSVTKRGQESEQGHQITILKAGEVVGELALIDNQKRSATVQALEETRLAGIDILAFQSNSQMLEIHSVLVKNIAHSLADRLRNSNAAVISGLERELSQVKARVALGLFTVNTLILASLYTLNMGAISQLVQKAQNSTFVSAPIILIFATLFLVMMIKSYYPLEVYGITIKNWRKSIIEATLFSFFLLAMGVLVKFVVFYPEIVNQQMSLFKIAEIFHAGPAAIKETVMLMLMYACFCPLQELVARGGLQGSLSNFLVGSMKRRQWIAIIVSNLIFAQAHIHFNITFAAVTFVTGLFWGWLFARQKNLIGCSWSHVLIGVGGMFIIGFDFSN